MRALALVLLTTAVPARADEAIALPTDLARYHAWKSPTKEPVMVPARLWNMCTVPTALDYVLAEREYGPHAARPIRVYANSAAAAELAGAKAHFPTGAVIAKDKLGTTSSQPAVGVAFMLKRNETRFRETGGWEFRFYPETGDAAATHRACAACHGGAKAGDYVFGNERQD